MLYLITNRKICKNDYLSVLKDAVEARIDAIILREKDLCTEDLLNLALDVKKITQNTKTKLIVNGNLEVAEKIEADGYQLSFSEFKRGVPNFKGLIGVSVHSLEEALDADKLGASYILASHIFPTDCKKGLPPRGVLWLREITKRVSIPVIALGGININNAHEVIKVGSQGVAVMSFIMSANDPKKKVLEFKKTINTYLQK